MLEASTVPGDTNGDIAGSILLPSELFVELSDTNTGLVFTLFESSVLFPLFNEMRPTFAVASTVVGATIAGQDTSNLPRNVTIVLRLADSVSV